ncbi:MAG: NAD(P)-dependent alcohol dehydrogenase [Chloroflexota bacterium]
MKAIIQTKYGSPRDVLHLQEVEMPAVGDNEVLVRVAAASVNPDIWNTVTGQPFVFRWLWGGWRKPNPAIPGTDMAGTVEEVGSNVTRFKPGDEVFGESNKGFQWTNGGAYAEYVSVPEDVLALKPSAVPFEEAASVPTSGYIALANLPDGNQIQPGQHVLINGAGGGVGSIAVQLAKAYGAEITGVDSSEKLAMIRSLGADHVIDYTQEDYTQEDLTKENRAYHLILDVASTLALSTCKQLLAPGGIFVHIGHAHYGSVGGSLLGNLPQFFSMMMRIQMDRKLPAPNNSMPSRNKSMATLMKLLETGKLTPIIDSTYPLSQVPQALEYLKSGQNVGKVIVTP